MSIKGLYIHIPFSDHIVGNVLVFNNTFSYIEDVIQALQQKQSYYESIYIGGGNLTKLSTDLIEKLLQALPEFETLSVELNPYYLDTHKVHLLKEMGVNRICLGVQYEDNDMYHFEEAMNMLNMFENISLEIPYGLKDQTHQEFENALTKSIALNPKHISMVPESEDEAFYDMAVYLLAQSGYEQYELLSFCKKGYESPQTLIYYEDLDYDAIGGTAKIHNQRISEEEIEILDAKDLVFEYIYMNLHLKKGINLTLFKNRFGYELNLKHPLLEEKNNQLYLKDLKTLNVLMDDMD